MDLGAFSISLAVKDIEASKAFYEKLGFEEFGGDVTQHWLILKNGPHVIGLFQGMFDRNTLTFNPGWDSDATQLSAFTDVRELQRRLKAQGEHGGAGKLCRDGSGWQSNPRRSARLNLSAPRDSRRRTMTDRSAPQEHR